MNQSQKEFEAWAGSKHDISKSGDAYISDHTDDLWLCWQASRATLVVELPTNRLATGIYMQHEVKSAIDAAGVKYK